MPQDKYSREEVDTILGRAIERDTHGELSHEDLLSAAREVGISEQAIETAAREIVAARGRRAELVELRRDQWRGFVAHLIPYVMVNGLLVTINALTTHFPWAVFPALGWGVGLASHLWAVLFPSRQHQQYHLEQLRALDAHRDRIEGSASAAQSEIGRRPRVLLQDNEARTDDFDNDLGAQASPANRTKS